MSDWKEHKLSEIMDIIGGGTPKTTNPKYWNGGIPWLSVVDFGDNNKYVSETEKTISTSGLQNSSTKILKEGQIIISARGTVGELAMLTKDMAFNQSCYGLDAKPELCSNGYLYYLLKVKIEELQRNAHGAVFDTITRNTFNTITVKIPSLPTQTAIAEILSSLDDKIELNNEINKNLEVLAQALFKHWFVDFEFPDENGQPYKSSGGEMVESELGLIPKGWRAGKINEISLLKGGATPSTKEPSFWNGQYHWTSPKDLSNNQFPVLLQTDKTITREGIKKISSGLLPKGTLLLSSRAPIGYLAITEIETAINQGYIAIHCKNGISNLFMLFWLKLNMDSVKEMANGSTFLEISKSNFKQIKLVIPDVKTHDKGIEAINSMFNQIIINLKTNQYLAKLRDTLLPKLISGELEVKEAIKQTEKVL